MQRITQEYLGNIDSGEDLLSREGRPEDGTRHGFEGQPCFLEKNSGKGILSSAGEHARYLCIQSGRQARREKEWSSV